MAKKDTQGLKKLGQRMRRQAGASMVEVMVAFLILSIGLLGLAMLQAKSLSLNTDAYLRSQATLIAHELIENMRGNPNGNYVVASKPGGVCGGCPAEQKKADADLISWYQAQEDLLPANTSTIQRPGADYVIEMKWKEKNIDVKQVWQVSI